MVVGRRLFTDPINVRHLAPGTPKESRVQDTEADPVAPEGRAGNAVHAEPQVPIRITGDLPCQMKSISPCLFSTSYAMQNRRADIHLNIREFGWGGSQSCPEQPNNPPDYFPIAILDVAQVPVLVDHAQGAGAARSSQEAAHLFRIEAQTLEA
jgi:hypothetical protein